MTHILVHGKNVPKWWEPPGSNIQNRKRDVLRNDKLWSTRTNTVLNDSG